MYAIAILRFIPQLYEHLFLLNTTKMSSQCPDYLDPGKFACEQAN
ncbi:MULTISPECIES: hypothetical protein [unclassified Wolbachia]|nr:hypothetical protein N499_0752 [Wolbachia pipientis wVitA]